MIGFSIYRIYHLAEDLFFVQAEIPIQIAKSS